MQPIHAESPPRAGTAGHAAASRRAGHTPPLSRAAEPPLAPVAKPPLELPLPSPPPGVVGPPASLPTGTGTTAIVHAMAVMHPAAMSVRTTPGP
jgi:hypothetical protein